VRHSNARYKYSIANHFNEKPFIKFCSQNFAYIVLKKKTATFVDSSPESIVYFYINTELYISLCWTWGSINKTEILLTTEPNFIVIGRFKANIFLKRNFDWTQIQQCVSVHNQLNRTQSKTFCFDVACSKTVIIFPANTNWHVIFCRILFNRQAEKLYCLVRSRFMEGN
jgi:hypothetical protein